MGVISALARAGTRRLHVLIIEVPGSSLLRMKTQAALSPRGWVEAVGPADADVLLVCGSPSGPLLAIIDAVWEQIPAPRYRVILTAVDSLGDVLDALPTALRDDGRQRLDAHSRRMTLNNNRGPDSTVSSEPPDTGESADGDNGNAASNNDAEMDASEGMDMDMDMSGPAGIPLAEGAQDRDGLEMDVTHLSIGPVLTGWPAALVVHATLHGDVITEARIERLPAGADTPQPPEAATLIDDAARLLLVAGWEPVALELGRVRNNLISGDNTDYIRLRLRRATARVRRSRTLRWSIAGHNSTQDGTVRDRLISWLETAIELVGSTPGEKEPGEAASPREITESNIREAIVGQELSAARLIVASFGTLPFRVVDVAHG
jgi:hypothetical protein